MKKRSIFQVDSFTNKPFKGNPAGVMFVDADTPTEWMQNVAMEMNLSETAFIIPKTDYFRIRYFTPTREVPLCGHATLASAHIIYELGLVEPSETIKFHADKGELTVGKDGDWLVMNFPVYPLTQVEVPKGFRATIGFEPIEIYSSDDDWVIAVAGSDEQIRTANPNFEQMVANGFGHVMITAKSETNDADFVVRCFAPSSGINEDPVTGSAHCALTPLWAKKLGAKELTSLQVSKRTGQLKVKLENNRVIIKGKALTIFEAQLRI